ncbi:carboxymuconolactone decarboxylase family protein [Chengkuizengella axinellae]|uniref:Carboxymuconolactone decarboxylase family protein n=1 Tax=Chengkuizengella axinellae TaxID=3064388 RepID=A0ABT9J303_9BACL|nr:carboxymuconolactone decarboxylase family protein [Chengkuizengella sp. 2205SS18-9]MDP5275943.1 carboxymuconolactone decarboxylase family protein [Chengkuizengella sp. 2205SS18-9]
MLDLSTELSGVFNQFYEKTIEGESLSEKEKVVAILTAATILGDKDTLKNIVISAKQLGFTNEQLGQINGITIAIRGQHLKNQFHVKVENKQANSCCQ